MRLTRPRIKLRTHGTKIRSSTAHTDSAAKVAANHIGIETVSVMLSAGIHEPASKL